MPEQGTNIELSLGEDRQLRGLPGCRAVRATRRGQRPGWSRDRQGTSTQVAVTPALLFAALKPVASLGETGLFSHYLRSQSGTGPRGWWGGGGGANLQKIDGCVAMVMRADTQAALLTVVLFQNKTSPKSHLGISVVSTTRP
jgi:hypothetical protein